MWIRKRAQTVASGEPGASITGVAIGWLAAIALLLAPLACFGRTAPPDGSSAPHFESAELAQQAGLGARIWRYLPLARGAPPTREAFARTARACLARHPSGSEVGDALPQTAEPDPRQQALLFCMTQRGFYPSVCNDGRDNDGDGLIDYPRDPGCAEPTAITENPSCDDGRDNDGDGLIDWDGGGLAHPDPDCKDAAASNREVRRDSQS